MITYQNGAPGQIGRIVQSHAVMVLSQKLDFGLTKMAQKRTRHTHNKSAVIKMLSAQVSEGNNIFLVKCHAKL